MANRRWVEGSYQVADRLFGADHGPGGEGFLGTTGVDLVSDQAVFVLVDDFEELN
jgi:hypothetical protein